MRLFLLIASLLLIVGCVSPYAQFYKDTSGGIDVSTHPMVIQSNDPPQLFSGSNQLDDEIIMLEKGYSLIGYSSFNAANGSDAQAILQAKKVHAHVVIVYRNYTNTRSGSLPMTTPNNRTTTSSYSGNVYGYGGSASYYGSGTSTTYGSQTTYIPYSVDRYDYLATYWVKTDTSKLSLGVRWGDLTDEQKQAIGSNKGVDIIAVIKGTPAYYEDIIRGDVLKKINGDEIYDIKDASEKIGKYKGQKVEITLIRKGKEIIKTVQLR
jgi:hypothetical protein